MKTRFSLAGILALALGVMPFAGGCAQTAAQSAAVTNSVETKVATPAPASPTPITPASTNLAASAIQPAAELAEPAAATEKPTPVKPAVEEPPPANLKVSPGLREVLKMVKVGVGKDVLTAFVSESKERFTLGPEEIIYLNDLGVADEVTTAMIERDRVLRGDAEPAAAPVPPPAVTPQSTPEPENPALYAPQYQTAAAAPAPVAQPEPVQTVATPDSDATYFYDSLAPYGNWVNVPSYGMCWQPTVVVTTPTWRPYLDCGRWVWSDRGWYWLSDYSWGWAPFHYGRWFYHGNHGWVWRPGRTWGPAWVSWRNSDDYCGWAPLPPEAGFVSGIGLTWHGGGVSWDFEFGLGWSSYCFLPVATFCDYSPRRYVVHHDRGHDVWRHTRVVNKIKINGDNNTVVVDGNGRNRVRVKGDNNTVIFEGGANPSHVETASRAPVRRVRIKDAEGDPSKGRRPDRIEREGSEFVVYKPELPARASDRARSAVARVAAQPDRTPDRIRNNGGRSERAPNNLKAVDARNNRADDRRATSVAVAPPAPAPALNTARPNPSGRIRDREPGNVGERQEPKVAETANSRDAARERTAVTRTPDSLVIRGNNTTPARNANNPAASQLSAPGRAPATTTPVTPVARVERPRATDQPKAEAAVRPGDARSNRSAPAANATRPTTPTPVTKATPITQPYRIERVEPIRVWNTPLPQTSYPSQANQPNQPSQPNTDRNGNPALNSPFRGYTPAPGTTPSVENYRQDRNVDRNDGRVDRAPAVNAPAYRAPAPAPAPAYSAPERSRSEAVRVERDRGGDNGNNNRSSGGGGNSGGGGGGGGGRNDNDGGNRAGRNR